MPRRLLAAPAFPVSGPAREKGDIKALEDDLHGYYRVKVRSYRIVYAYRGTKRPGPPEIDVLFCEHRSNVYETFSAIAATRLPI